MRSLSFFMKVIKIGPFKDMEPVQGLPDAAPAWIKRLSHPTP